jgi:VWFA-related protein
MTRAILAILLSLQIAFARQEPPPPLPEDAPAPSSKRDIKFSTTTQLVVINVSVRDKNGQNVEGLKASDFTVTEDGKPQQLKVFERQKLDDTPLQPPALVSRKETETPAIAAPAAKAAVSTPIAPSRAGEVKYKDRRLLVLFFDLAGMTTSDQIRAQQAALRFLSTRMAQSDLVAVMTYDTSLEVLQDFTGDRDRLTGIVRGLPIGTVGMSNGSTGDDSEGVRGEDAGNSA